MGVLHGGEVLGPGRFGDVAVEIDADGARLPARHSFEDYGERLVPQWPAPTRDVLVGRADQKDAAVGGFCRRLARPGYPQRVVGQEFHRLQPAVIAGHDDYRGNKMSAGEHQDRGVAR